MKCIHIFGQNQHWLTSCLIIAKLKMKPQAIEKLGDKLWVTRWPKIWLRTFLLVYQLSFFIIILMLAYPKIALRNRATIYYIFKYALDCMAWVTVILLHLHKYVNTPMIFTVYKTTNELIVHSYFFVWQDLCHSTERIWLTIDERRWTINWGSWTA